MPLGHARAALLLLSVSLALQSSACGHHDGERNERDHHPGPNAMHDHDRHHRFDDAERWAKMFDDPARDEWQKPEAVIDKLALSPSSVVADIGAGTGYFAVRIAKRGARVVAIDIEPDMVRYLEERARRDGVADKVRAVLGAADDPHLDEKVDVILVVDTVHHIDGRTAYFARLRGQLREGGRLVVVDFKPGESPVGPPPAMRIAAAQLTGELEAAGYQAIDVDEATLPYQYIASYASR